MGPGKNLHREMDIHNKWNGPINGQINYLNSFDDFCLVEKQLDIYKIFMLLIWFAKWNQKSNSKSGHDIINSNFPQKIVIVTTVGWNKSVVQ